MTDTNQTAGNLAASKGAAETAPIKTAMEIGDILKILPHRFPFLLIDRVVDIVPGERVVHAVDFVSDDPAYAGTMIMNWEVGAVDAGTRVSIVAEDVPDGISAEDHAAGLASSLVKLAAYLEQ